LEPIDDASLDFQSLFYFVFSFSVILGIHVSNLIKDSFGCGFFHYISFTHWLHQNRNVVSLGCICLEQMFFEHYYIVMSFPIFLSWIKKKKKKKKKQNRKLIGNKRKELKKKRKQEKKTESKIDRQDRKSGG